VAPEEMDEFERELRQAMERRPAPPGLKRKLMAQRSANAARSGWWTRLVTTGQGRGWATATAALLLLAMAGGGVRWELDKRQEQRKGEAAREQVMTALRITGHALNEVQTRLAEHDRQAGEGER
jgi:hypothetical protein